MKCIRIFGGRLKINIILIFAVFGMILLGMWDTVLCFVPALLLHELAHILAAGACGIILEDLELLPFGCAAKVRSFAGLPPVKEIFVAAAGPAFNMIAAGALYFFDKYCFKLYFAKPLILANLVLAAANMLPALPLDGGRILRALLSKFMGNKKATRICAYFGVFFSIVILALGIYAAFTGTLNYSMFIIPVFLFYAAVKELKSAPYKLIRDIEGKKKTMTEGKTMNVCSFAALSSIKLKDVLKELDAGRFNIVYVLNREMKAEYSISEADILEGMMKYGAEAPLLRLTEKKQN